VESCGNPKLTQSGAAAFHRAVPPLSRFHLAISLFFPSCHVAGTSHGELWWEDLGGGRSVRGLLVLYERTAHATPQARQLRGSPGEIYDQYDQFFINHVPSLRESYFNSRAHAPPLSPTHSDPRFDFSASLFLHQQCQTLNG
jgi:hypothetical protein